MLRFCSWAGSTASSSILQHRPLDGAAEHQRHAQALGAPNGSNLPDPRGGQAAHWGKSTAHQVTPASPSQGMARLVGLEPTCLSADCATHLHCQRPTFNRLTGGFARCTANKGKADPCRSPTLVVATVPVKMSSSQRQHRPRHTGLSVPIDRLAREKRLLVEPRSCSRCSSSLSPTPCTTRCTRCARRHDYSARSWADTTSTSVLSATGEQATHGAAPSDGPGTKCTGAGVRGYAHRGSGRGTSERRVLGVGLNGGLALSSTRGGGDGGPG
jgi:hypothetical protein